MEQNIMSALDKKVLDMYVDVQELKKKVDHLEQDNQQLREDVRLLHDYINIIGGVNSTERI